MGYDLDPAYVEIRWPVWRRQAVRTAVAVALAMGDGTAAMALACETIEAAGFRDVRPNRRLRGLGMAVSFSAVGAGGRTWYFDVAGTNSSYRGGMSKSETVWRTLGRAHVMAAGGVGPLVVLTTQVPRAGTEADRALRAPGPGGIFDVVDLLVCRRGRAADGVCEEPRRRAAAGVLGRSRTWRPGQV